MPFGAPELSVLDQRIGRLHKNYSILIGRYEIAASPEEKESEQCPKTILGLLISRTKKYVLNCSTDRKSQQDVFRQLIHEMSDSEAQHNEKAASLFLLGALLHRYFRLLDEYDTINETIKASTFNFLGLFQPTLSDIKSCRLFCALRNALHLPAMKNTEDFRKKDLELLDVVTIFKALECFYKNMLENNRFQQYPHLAGDINFFYHLEKIMNTHYQRGKDTLEQFKAIDFIHSFTLALSQEHAQIENALDIWSRKLRTDIRTFNDLEPGKLEEHLLSLASIDSKLKAKLLELLRAPHIADNLITHTLETFIQMMKECHSMRSSYIILGGCTLLLESKQVTNPLKYCIYQVLDIEEQRELLTDQDKKDAVDALRTLYLESDAIQEAEINFDISFFGTERLFKTAIAQLNYTLTARMLSPALSPTV